MLEQRRRYCLSGFRTCRRLTHDGLYQRLVGFPAPSAALQVKKPGPTNRIDAPDVTQDMKPIRGQHIAVPGLVVVDIAAADDDTAFAFQEELAKRWATAVDDRTTRTPGEPGVRLRCYLDLCQELPAVVDPTTA